MRIVFFLIFSLSISLNISVGQNFGQNIVAHRTHDFKVEKTQYFNFYHYCDNKKILETFIKESNIWYEYYRKVFGFDLPLKNPIILYNYHADFRGTSAIDGSIGYGTGGVTESLKNRIVMPFFPLRNQNRHVFGHELVHAFQYKALFEIAGLNLSDISKIPLWLIEGMAEYLSVGRIDAHTAMWMRDAVINQDIPTLKDLSRSNKYFPYRYGQAFWAFVTALYGGDDIVTPLFIETGRVGLELALQKILGYGSESLSHIWKQSLIKHYGQFKKSEKDELKGKVLVDSINGGNVNVSPALSPDGQKVIYLSSRDLISVDLFVQSTKNKKAKQKKLINKSFKPHLDEYNYIESSGSWSPDGKQFVLSAFSKGRQILIIIDIDSRKISKNIIIPEVIEFTNPSWSPDGKSIVFSGFDNNQSDLYIYHIDKEKTEKLTDDIYSDYLPSFSKDGKKIVFSTDRNNASYGNKEVKYTLQMAIYDVETQKINTVPVFPQADNIDPHFTSDGDSLIFLSNRDGFRNLYRYNLLTDRVYQLTDFFTGISGITEQSPAISISDNNQIAYTYYGKRKYTIAFAALDEFEEKEVPVNHFDLKAATLPMVEEDNPTEYATPLNNFNQLSALSNPTIQSAPYSANFQLDYLAPSGGIGIGYSSFYGAGVGGSIQARFSDILGEQRFIANIALQGELASAGISGAFINLKKRVNKFVSGGHIPRLSFIPGRFSQDAQFDIFGRIFDGTIDFHQIWTFQETLGGGFSYPFSRTLRLEAGGSLSYFSYLIYTFRDTYSNGFRVQSTRERVGDKQALAEHLNANDNNNFFFSARNFNNFESFFSAQAGLFLVGDNSSFGLTAPLNGYRFRIGLTQGLGFFDYLSTTFDVRFYKRVKPLTFALRFLNTNLLSNNANFFPNYIGYPFYIRGYTSFFSTNFTQSNNPSTNNLFGNSIAVGSFEIRLPLSGIKKLSVLDSKFFFADLNLFADAGLAWDQSSFIVWSSKTRETLQIDPITRELQPNRNPLSTDRYPVLTAGISLRISLFGQLILEPYYAFNLIDATFVGDKRSRLGFNLTPGW